MKREGEEGRGGSRAKRDCEVREKQRRSVFHKLTFGTSERRDERSSMDSSRLFTARDVYLPLQM